MKSTAIESEVAYAIGRFLLAAEIETAVADGFETGRK